METIGVVLAVIAALVITAECMPRPGDHHHVHHRIHVPQKIKTIYQTKIVKVPEHHHHYHEKEKIITIPVKKGHHHETFAQLEEEHGWEGGKGFGDDEHNLFKKHAPSFQKASASRKSPKTSLPAPSYAKTTVPRNVNGHVNPQGKSGTNRNKPRNTRTNRASLGGKTNNARPSNNNRKKPKRDNTDEESE